MSEERTPVWPWIAALLIGLPALYVASFGPACWVSSYVEDDRVHYYGERERLVDVIYQPILTLAWGDGWPHCRDIIDRYSRLASRPG